MSRSIAALALVLALVACACSTTRSNVAPGTPGGGTWLEPSPQLREQISDAAKKLPWTHGLERVELVHWFAQVGEPAYPVLLDMVLDPRKDVAGAALAALGATRDSRLVPSLQALPWPRQQDGDLALERARTLLRLGDWQMVPRLIEGLKDERLVTRALCIQALYEATHERLGFDARAEEPDRTAAVQKWEQWWQERENDPLLTAGTDSKPAQ
ncbi:MAG: hypothetical protein IPJ77_15595 [Planctomycetes bacterium]|nr:hypothetical protein [Planctomycetota bacterium]